MHYQSHITHQARGPPDLLVLALRGKILCLPYHPRVSTHAPYCNPSEDAAWLASSLFSGKCCTARRLASLTKEFLHYGINTG